MKGFTTKSYSFLIERLKYGPFQHLQTKLYSILLTNKYFLISLKRTSSSLNPNKYYRLYIPENYRNPLKRPFIFSIGASIGFFTLFAILENRHQRRNALFSSWNTGSIYTKRESSSSTWENLIKLLPLPIQSIIHEIQHYKDRLTISQRTIACIIGMNLVVFLAFKIPSLHTFLCRHFTNYLYGPSYTLITSVFSHESNLHFIMNMYGIYMIGTYVHERLGRHEFLFLYFTAGIWSSLMDLLYKYVKGIMAVSLGASGSAFSLLGASAHFPNLLIGIPLTGVFVPVLFGVVGFALYDLICLLSGKHTKIGHASHLAGSAFGYWYLWKGSDSIWAYRRKYLNLIGYTS